MSAAFDEITDALDAILLRASEADKVALSRAIVSYAEKYGRTYRALTGQMRGHRTAPALEALMNTLVEGSEAFYSLPESLGGRGEAA